MSSNIKLYQGDCLEIVQTIQPGSVDLVLCDPPYGIIKGANLDKWDKATTAWDNAIKPEDLLQCALRVLRPNGKAVFFSMDPYSSRLILSAPPCTEFSVLNCKAEPRQRKPEDGLKVVMACMRIIEKCKPVWWALENPVGHLREYMGKSALTFQPWEFGDPWTKRTDIWGNFTPPEKLYSRWEDVPDKLPLYTRPNRGKPNFAYLHKSAKALIPQLAWADPETDADFRSITPPGFARAFFEANP